MKRTFKMLLWLIIAMSVATAAYAQSGWDSPQTVDSTDQSGLYPSMAIVGGNPAISYQYSNTFSTQGLRYVRATDASGTGWGTPVNVVSGNPNVFYTSLAVVDGNPAIAYRDISAETIRYVRATNGTGSSWGAPVDVVNVGSQGGYLSLAVVNGRPAISYYHSSGGVWYVRANDAQGTSWGTPVEVDSDGDSGYTGLLVVNGKPAIAYYDSANLNYLLASDPDGDSWMTRQALDSTGVTGHPPSLLMVDNRPAIAYYEDSARDLMFIRANTPTAVTLTTAQVVAAPGWGGSGALAGIVLMLGGAGVLVWRRRR